MRASRRRQVSSVEADTVSLFDYTSLRTEAAIDVLDDRAGYAALLLERHGVRITFAPAGDRMLRGGSRSTNGRWP